MTYLTLVQSLSARAIEMLRRADQYRSKGKEQNARGCERKALRKFEQAFQLANLGSL